MLTVGPGTKWLFSAFLPHPQLLAGPVLPGHRGGLPPLAPPSAVNCCGLLLSNGLAVWAGWVLCSLGSVRLRQVFAFLELRSEAFSVFLPLLQARLCLVSVVGLDGREFCPPSGVGDLWYHGGILDPDSFPASPLTMRQMNFAWGSGRFSSLGSEDKRFAPASSVS